MRQAAVAALTAIVVATLAPPGAAANPAPLAAPWTATADDVGSGPAEALRFDLDKIVHLREQGGWGVDRLETEAMLGDALQSVCRTPPAARAALLRSLTAAIERERRAHGGDAGARWRAGARDLGALAPSLRIERVQRLLVAAMAAAPLDCPFWIEPSPTFAGWQRDSADWTLNAEGGGLASVRRARGAWRFGGGGAGRLSVGVGLAPAWNLRAGVELGGAALVDPDLRAEDVTVDFLFAAPVALRRLFGPYLIDIEAAPLMLGIPWQQAPQRWGGRVAVLAGFSALRLRSLLPWSGLVLMAEGVAPRDGVGAWLWTIRAGVRVGLAWRP